MGKKNNVNPDHYKTAGRELPGQDINHEIHKQKFTQAQKNEFGSEFMPGKEPENVTETPEETNETGEVKKSANSSNNN